MAPVCEAQLQAGTSPLVEGIRVGGSGSEAAAMVRGWLSCLQPWERTAPLHDSVSVSMKWGNSKAFLTAP